MKIFNTYSGQNETFVPIEKNKIGLYLCGPTVYDLPHLGHGRSAVTFDLIRKYLIFKGYNVVFVSNYTDIDDKMIKRAAEANISVKELADKIIPEYEKDYSALGILAANIQPKATETVPEMIKMIQTLQEKGHTYEISDGVYFDVSTFSDYGKLSKQKLDQLQSGKRVEQKEEKRNPQDFVLWKLSKPGEPSWESPWGAGRPGWHIECSAMSSKYLGDYFDMHGGGGDLTFPHHECEIAQSICATGKPFVKYWLHNGFIRVNEEKMSKSLNNFTTLRDTLKIYSGQVIRYFYLLTHYRSPIDFSTEVLESAKNSLRRIHDFIERLDREVSHDTDLPQAEIEEYIQKSEEKFTKHLDNDFDLPGGLSAIFDFIKNINVLIDEKKVNRIAFDKIIHFLQRIDNVIGIIFPTETVEISEEIAELIQEREKARENKNWAKSDEIRDILKAKGIVLEDTPQGTVWKKA